MNWGSDELHHRSAGLSGWCAELRAADPEEVDETVAGAVDYAARTNPLPDDADAPDAEDAELTGDRDLSDAPDPEDWVSEVDTGFDGCGGDISDGEALDAIGAPVDVGFQWVEAVEAYHRSCIDNGEGRFLPWAAIGVLRDETNG